MKFVQTICRVSGVPQANAHLNSQLQNENKSLSQNALLRTSAVRLRGQRLEPRSRLEPASAQSNQDQNITPWSRASLGGPPT